MSAARSSPGAFSDAISLSSFDVFIPRFSNTTVEACYCSIL